MVLGTSSGNPEIHKEFIASKAPDAPSKEEEVAALGVDEVEKKEMTIFPKLEDGTPFVWDYQIRGFFKAACGMMKNVAGSESSKIKAYKKYIDGLDYGQYNGLGQWRNSGMGRFTWKDITDRG